MSATSLVDLESRIALLRGVSVLLDSDLATLYEVSPGSLMQAVRRNARRSRPYAFTEQGVAMLSSVLRSNTAVLVNIEIMRGRTGVNQPPASLNAALQPVRPH